MSIFTRKDTKEKKEPKTSTYNDLKENELVVKIDTAQQYAEGGKRAKTEQAWSDEYKIYQGGGKQWDTSQGIRTEKGKKRNFNSEDNLVFPMVMNMHSAMTSSMPEVRYEGRETEDENAADMLNDLVPCILYRNNFRSQWKKIVLQGLQYGPFIGYVPWDQHWIGGSGPNRWVGEIRTLFLKKNEIFFDPAILDLEERMQECSFINLKKRKKLSWYAETWPVKGKYVIEDTEGIEEGLEDEGTDPQQATLITHFHKGVPYFVPEEWKKIFLEKAQEAEAESNLPYYAKDLRDMAAGTLKGVHCAYKAGSILLDYIPYIYDDGLYPFVYKVLYADEEQPFGMGEIRNTVKPQILHNLADETELVAMRGQGLGGGYYNKGALSPAQRDELLDNQAKTHAWVEVNDIHAMQPRQPVQVPSSIMAYKEYKRNMIDVTSQNTDIQKGISPGANVPFATIQALGARGDIRTKAKVEILEDFLQEFFQLIVNRIAQFYTEDRAYRIIGDSQASRVKDEAYKTLLQIATMPQGTPPEQQMQAMIQLLMMVKTQTLKPKTGVFNRKMLVRTWDRDIDENGNPMKEEYLPEFDLRVRVVDERPTNREYWTNLAMGTLGKALGSRCFWKIIDEGKLPPIEDILTELAEMQQAQQQAQMMALQAQQAMKDKEVTAQQQYGVMKQKMQNDSVEKQVAMKVMSKAGARNGQ